MLLAGAVVRCRFLRRLCCAVLLMFPAFLRWHQIAKRTSVTIIYVLRVYYVSGKGGGGAEGGVCSLYTRAPNGRNCVAKTCVQSRLLQCSLLRLRLLCDGRNRRAHARVHASTMRGCNDTHTPKNTHPNTSIRLGGMLYDTRSRFRSRLSLSHNRQGR